MKMGLVWCGVVVMAKAVVNGKLRFMNCYEASSPRRARSVSCGAAKKLRLHLDRTSPSNLLRDTLHSTVNSCLLGAHPPCGHL